MLCNRTWQDALGPPNSAWFEKCPYFGTKVFLLATRVMIIIIMALQFLHHSLEFCPWMEMTIDHFPSFPLYNYYRCIKEKVIACCYHSDEEISSQ